MIHWFKSGYCIKSRDSLYRPNISWWSFIVLQGIIDAMMRNAESQCPHMYEVSHVTWASASRFLNRLLFYRKYKPSSEHALTSAVPSLRAAYAKMSSRRQAQTWWIEWGRDVRLLDRNSLAHRVFYAANLTWRWPRFFPTASQIIFSTPSPIPTPHWWVACVACVACHFRYLGHCTRLVCRCWFRHELDSSRLD